MSPLDPPDVFEIRAIARRRCRLSLKGVGIRPACASTDCTDCAAMLDAIASFMEATTPNHARQSRHATNVRVLREHPWYERTLDESRRALPMIVTQAGGDRSGLSGFASLGNGGFRKRRGIRV